MSNTLLVKISNSHGNLSSVELDNVFRESFLALENFIELPTSNKGHDEVKSKLRLEEVVHTNEERVVTGEEDILL